MKKTVILILILLPIVLLITIAFAGRIFSEYRHVAVEKVRFVDDAGDALAADFMFKVNVGESRDTSIRIFPELASNKTVSYTSSDSSVCTVDARGRVTGVAIGNATVTVKTFDGSKTAVLAVRVTADRVTGVTLSPASLSLVVGQPQMLNAIVEPYAALNKNVTFSSSAPSVAGVSVNGTVTAHAEGTAIITVTTEDGNFQATCTVTVTSGTPPLSFDLSSAPGITQQNEGYISTVSVIDLSQYLTLDTEKVQLSDVRFHVNSGNGTVTEGGVLTLGSGIVNVIAYVGSKDAPTYQTGVLKIFYQP